MRIEMHSHTAEVSPCAHVYAKDMITACKKANYDAVIITDHFNDYVLGSFPGNNRDKVRRYLLGYETAKAAEKEVGIKVLFGVEVCIAGGREDFLLYGITPSFLFDNPRLFTLTQQELYDVAHAAGALVYQAHPCRSYCKPRDPFLMDGAEVYNGNHNYLEGGREIGSYLSNDTTLRWAKKYPHLLYISASDVHSLKDVGNAGIIVPDMDKEITELDLPNILKSKQIELIRVNK